MCKLYKCPCGWIGTTSEMIDPDLVFIDVYETRDNYKQDSWECPRCLLVLGRDGYIEEEYEIDEE